MKWHASLVVASLVAVLLPAGSQPTRAATIRVRYVIARPPFINDDDDAREIGEEIRYKLIAGGMQEEECEHAHPSDEFVRQHPLAPGEELLRIKRNTHGNVTNLQLEFTHPDSTVVGGGPVTCGDMLAKDCVRNEAKLTRLVEAIRAHHKACHQEAPCSSTNQRPEYSSR